MVSVLGSRMVVTGAGGDEEYERCLRHKLASSKGVNPGDLMHSIMTIDNNNRHFIHPKFTQCYMLNIFQL